MGVWVQVEKYKWRWYNQDRKRVASVWWLPNSASSSSYFYDLAGDMGSVRAKTPEEALDTVFMKVIEQRL